MQKLTNWIFNLSPKKIAIYLVLGPLILFFAHTIISIAFRYIGSSGEMPLAVVISTLSLFALLFALLVLIWLFWMISTVFNVGEANIGLPILFFKIAIAVLTFYLIYQLCFSFFDYVPEEFQYIFYSLNEFIAFAGLIFAYPTICHFTARAIYFKKNNEKASFLKSIGYTLLLVFIPISIPFFHKYFSNKSSENKQMLIIYSIAAATCVLLFIAVFIAAITGLV